MYHFSLPTCFYFYKMKVMPRAIESGIRTMKKLFQEKSYQFDGVENDPTMALQIACAVVTVMENDAAFNAGYGSMPNEECNIEMDAAVMDGKDRRYGSVAVIGEPF